MKGEGSITIKAAVLCYASVEIILMVGNDWHHLVPSEGNSCVFCEAPVRPDCARDSPTVLVSLVPLEGKAPLREQDLLLYGKRLVCQP